jgi:hypothetical protein
LYRDRCLWLETKKIMSKAVCVVSCSALPKIIATHQQWSDTTRQQCWTLEVLLLNVQ